MQTASGTNAFPQAPPLAHSEKVFTQTALGLVGTGRTPADARSDLMEKIRQAGEH